MNCGCEFETSWISSQFVSCPKCGSRRIVRIDPYRGRGIGPRFRRGICRGRFGKPW